MDQIDVVLSNFGMNPATYQQGDLNGDATVNVPDVIIAITNPNNQSQQPPPATGGQDVNCIGLFLPDGSPCPDGGGGPTGTGSGDGNTTPGGDACANINFLLNQPPPLTAEECAAIAMCITALVNDIGAGLPNTPEGMTLSQATQTRDVALAGAIDQLGKDTKVTTGRILKGAGIGFAAGAAAGAASGIVAAKIAKGPLKVWAYVGATAGAIVGVVIVTPPRVALEITNAREDYKTGVIKFNRAGNGTLPPGSDIGVPSSLYNAGLAFAAAKAALEQLLADAIALANAAIQFDSDNCPPPPLGP